MQHSVYNLRNFYVSKSGRLIRRLLLRHILRLWPDVAGLRVMGYGYATPYMKALRDRTERVIALMPAEQGAHTWPDDGANLVAVAEDGGIPLETESVDRIILVHALESAQHYDQLMKELWRILKSNGRMMIIVPNRLGLWTRADWTPFGHGRPWSMGQVQHVLEENMFTVERTDRALFMPPFRSFLMLRSAYLLESVGRAIFPGLAGVYIVEAGKQIYATRGKGVKDTQRTGLILVPGTARALSRSNSRR